MEINSIRVLLFVFGLILLRDIDEVFWPCRGWQLKKHAFKN